MKRLTKTGWTSALLSISLMAGAPRGEAQTVPCSSALERSGARQEGARAGRLVSQGLAAARCDSLVPQAPRPAYLTPVVDSTFGSVVERITNDAGLPTSPVPGTWGSDARHVYSKQQPWNSDNTLLTIENRGGGSPTRLILDGKTFAPKLAPCANYDLWDSRWHPSRAHPHEQINVNHAGNELLSFA